MACESPPQFVEVVRKVQNTTFVFLRARNALRETRCAKRAARNALPNAFFSFGRHDADALILVVLVLPGSNAALLHGCT